MYIDEPTELLVGFDIDRYYINRGIEYLSKILKRDEEEIEKVVEERRDLKEYVKELGELTGLGEKLKELLIFWRREDYKFVRMALVEKCKEILEDVLGKFDD